MAFEDGGGRGSWTRLSGAVGRKGTMVRDEETALSDLRRVVSSGSPSGLAPASVREASVPEEAPQEDPGGMALGES